MQAESQLPPQPDIRPDNISHIAKLCRLQTVIFVIHNPNSTTRGQYSNSLVDLCVAEHFLVCCDEGSDAEHTLLVGQQQPRVMRTCKGVNNK